MVAVTTAQQQEIQQILQVEVECVNALLQALELEYSALAEHHAQALEDAVRSKQEKILQLETITRQRENLLISFGNITLDENLAEKKPELFCDNRQLSGLWHQLVELAQKCREKNRINGSIVETASRQSRQALDILRGIVPNAASATETYDHSGQTRSHNNKHLLVHV